jgi:hypothetical protein
VSVLTTSRIGCSAEREERSVRLRENARDASRSTGMALFAFAIAFATLAVQFEHYQDTLYALAATAVLFGLAFTWFPLRGIWEEAAIVWRTASEPKGRLQVRWFRLTSNLLTVLSLVAGVAIFVVDVLKG